MNRIVLVLSCFLLFVSSFLSAQVVNVYSARHYDTDDEIYGKFEKKTGIKVNLIEGGSGAMLERLKREGKRSPADVFITVDAGRLYQAELAGGFPTGKAAVFFRLGPGNRGDPEG